MQPHNVQRSVGCCAITAHPEGSPCFSSPRRRIAAFKPKRTTWQGHPECQPVSDGIGSKDRSIRSIDTCRRGDVFRWSHAPTGRCSGATGVKHQKISKAFIQHVPCHQSRRFRPESEDNTVVERFVAFFFIRCVARNDVQEHT